MESISPVVTILCIIINLVEYGLTEISLGGMESWGFNGVRSGRVSLMSKDKLLIRGLDYTGEGPAVWFMVGKEEDPYNEEFGELKGVVIPDESGSCDRLQRYRNEDVMLRLPKGMNFTDYDYLAIYCTKFNHNFGYVKLKREGVDFGALQDDVGDDGEYPKACPQDHLDEEEEDEEEEEEEEEEEDEERPGGGDDDRKKKRKGKKKRGNGGNLKR